LINTHHQGDHPGGSLAFKALVKKLVGNANYLAKHQKTSATQKSEDKQLFADTVFQDQ